MFICGIVSFFHCCMHSEVMISLANSSIFSIQYDNFCILHVVVTKNSVFKSFFLLFVQIRPQLLLVGLIYH